MVMDPSKAQRQTLEALMGPGSVGAVPGEELVVYGGDTVRITATVEYRGPAISDRLYGAIGERGIFFDEIWNGTGPLFEFPLSINWLPYTLTVDIVTDAEHPHANYDIYVKLLDHSEAGLPEVADAIDVIGVAEFRNFAITSYDKA